ncbi:MAG: imidazole glycerol phosphate synthase subunit HisH [Ruminococcaceae bacterium]|nr:imidazole glycerol phosphate synthase subunit HisH [Oscillospiraceae bacterium]
MVAIVDYGVGNLFSLKSSLTAIGADVVITSDKEILKTANQIILPGVGAFEDAAKKLRKNGLDKVIKELADGGKPLMGICLGMQLLLDKSYEYGEHDGLGLIKGIVAPIKDDVTSEYKIPHIGWNPLKLNGDSSPIFKYIQDGDCVYFVHSYYAKNCEESIIATAEYGTELTAAIAKNNVFGCQFHPEKSGKVGLNILKAFIDLKEENYADLSGDRFV